MVQAVDNLTTIIGTILSLSDHPTLSGYEIVMLRLEEARPVAGKADLITGRLADRVPVAVPRELLGNAQPGWRLRCRAKRTPDGAMCEPHPAPGELSLLPS
jgi:hypothetical protein